jgi:hypothetical protein
MRRESSTTLAADGVLHDEEDGERQTATAYERRYGREAILGVSSLIFTVVYSVRLSSSTHVHAALEILPGVLARTCLISCTPRCDLEKLLSFLPFFFSPLLFFSFFSRFCSCGRKLGG